MKGEDKALVKGAERRARKESPKKRKKRKRAQRSEIRKKQSLDRARS